MTFVFFAFLFLFLIVQRNTNEGGLLRVLEEVRDDGDQRRDEAHLQCGVSIAGKNSEPKGELE